MKTATQPGTYDIGRSFILQHCAYEFVNSAMEFSQGMEEKIH